jgi:K(+)-stimulated pyrophosphate-energized sodium pump
MHLAIGSMTPFEQSALWATLAIAVAGLAYAAFLARQILALPQGTPRMQQVSQAIREGANAYLRQQFKLVAVFVAGLAVVVFAFTRVEGHFQLATALARSVAFIAGAGFSAAVGWLGMNMAVRGSLRTVAAAEAKGFSAALQVAYRTGTVTGMLTDGLGLLGGTVIFLFYGLKSYEVLMGFGLGACLLALFMRVGGGIYTKAADIGADYVGKLENDIPEDDPRNAATVADLVGDNVGDCAGMAADIFESYEVTMVAAMILGAAAFGVMGVIFPVLVRAAGVLSSIVGTYAVRADGDDEDALKAITRGYLVSGALTVAAFFLLGWFYFRPNGVVDLRAAWATFTGIALAVAIHKISEYFTSAAHEPVKEVVRSTSTGHATTILSGLALGFESAAWTAGAIVAAVLAASLVFAGGGLLEIGYGVALCGVGMLTLTGNNLSMDVFGPVVDNANGIGEMAKAPTAARRVLDNLDSVGNTTKAITKGVAIASAVIAAISLFSSFAEEACKALGLYLVDAGGALRLNSLGDRIPNLDAIQLSLNDPRIFLGAVLGATMPFIFSAQLIRAVFRGAAVIIQEVRLQFRTIPGLMQGKALPDYGKVVRICTRTAEQELMLPGLLAILAPLAVGAGLGFRAMGGFLGGAILSGQLLAVFMSNAGGAWDNAKKAIEGGLEGGKGSPGHKAAVTGDTVGDPLKDTAGPALNPLIKVMNLFGIMALPVLVGLESSEAPGAFPALRLSLAALLTGILAAVAIRSRRPATLVTASAHPGPAAKARRLRPSRARVRA